MIGTWTIIAIAVLVFLAGLAAGAFVILCLLFGNPVPWKWRDAFKLWRYRTVDRIRAMLGLPPA